MNNFYYFQRSTYFLATIYVNGVINNYIVDIEDNKYCTGTALYYKILKEFKEKLIFCIFGSDNTTDVHFTRLGITEYQELKNRGTPSIKKLSGKKLQKAQRNFY